MLLLLLWNYVCEENNTQDKKIKLPQSNNKCSQTSNTIIIVLLIILSLWAAWLSLKINLDTPMLTNDNELTNRILSGFLGIIIGIALGPIYILYYLIFHYWIRIGCQAKSNTGGECLFWPLCGKGQYLNIGGMCKKTTILEALTGIY